jgi:hypothetical protein
MDFRAGVQLGTGLMPGLWIAGVQVRSGFGLFALKVELRNIRTGR